MAICARYPSPHDALGTDRYRPNPPARFLRAAADSNAHLLLFPLPDRVALSGLVLHHESAPETVRNVANVQLQISKRTNEVWTNKNPPQYPVLERAIHVFARRESFFLFKLQPKRWLQWVQAVTQPHPSNSRQSNMRTENRGMEKKKNPKTQNPTGTSQIRLHKGGKKRTWFPWTSEAALGFLLPTQPLRFCFWRMLSLIRAWRTARSARLVIHQCSWKDKKLRYPIYRRFPPNLPFILGLVGGLKSSTTALLITSARHGNFVTQNRNALFWWDGDPWACPAYHGQILVQLFPHLRMNL